MTLPISTNPVLKIFFPFLDWLPKITQAQIRADITAGLSGAIVALPQGIAFATIAGMPAEYGLYAGIVPAIIAALFGSSWHLVSGPTTAASIVLLSILSPIAEPSSPQYVQLALTLTFMVGVLQFIMGLLRLGSLVDFISHSVIIGFTAGAAVLIAANQAKHFFGLSIPSGSHLHDVILFLVTHVQDIDLASTSVAIFTLLVGIITRALSPTIPYMIVATFCGGLMAFVLNSTGWTVPTIGALPATLPPLSFPLVSSVEIVGQLVPGALAMTLFALTEAVSIARALAVKSGQRTNGSQEFIGQGLSNIIGSFFSAYIATGSFNRSGLNYQAGAKTPLSAIFAGGLLAVIVVLFAPLTAYLPNSAMAGVLFLVAWGLIDFHHIARIFKSNRAETAVLAVTFLSAIFAELEFAIFAGVILSLLLYLNRTARPLILGLIPDPSDPKRRFISSPSLRECPQVKIVRIDGSLFFGAVPYVLSRLANRSRQQKHLVIVASAVNFIDTAGAEALVQEAKHLREIGGELYLVHLKERPLQFLTQGGYLQELREQNLFESKMIALATVQNKFSRAICRNCHGGVFLECSVLQGKAS